MRRGLRSPIHCIGGKGMMVAKLLPLFPPHKHYIEPFGGGASLLLAKKPCGGVETYNDIDGGLVDFFKVIADPILFQSFFEKVKCLPYSRKLYYEAREGWSKEKNMIDRVAMWFVMARQGFSGTFGKGGWSFNVTTSNRNIAAATSKWLSCIDMLGEISARLRTVQIECNDFRRVLKTYDGEGYLAYCDPPYILDTLSGSKNLYSYEMSGEDHKDLVKLLLDYRGSVVLSGYENDLYSVFDLEGWQRVEFKMVSFAAGRTRNTGILGKGAALKRVPRVEYVWRNPMAIRTAGESWDKMEGFLF